MKKCVWGHPKDGPGAVRRGCACGGSPGAEKGRWHYGFLEVFWERILIVFLCFFLDVIFHEKTWFFAGATHYGAVWGVAAVEVAFRSLLGRSESAKSDPGEAEETMQGNQRKACFCNEAGTLAIECLVRAKRRFAQNA